MGLPNSEEQMNIWQRFVNEQNTPKRPEVIGMTTEEAITASLRNKIAITVECSIKSMTITGDLLIDKDERLSDLMENSDRFIKLTDVAMVESKSNQSLVRTMPFMLLNKDKILYMTEIM